MNTFLGKVPNLLTVLRIASAPALIILMLEEKYEAALLLFVIAGITDGLDGWIAKRFNCVTELGARLDPLADKILIISAFCMLAWLDRVPFELVLLVIFRDIVIVGGYLVLTLDDDIPMQPSLISKANTFFQITFVIVVLLENTIWMEPNFLHGVLMWLVALSTVTSGVQYVWVWAFRRTYRQTETQDAER